MSLESEIVSYNFSSEADIGCADQGLESEIVSYNFSSEAETDPQNHLFNYTPARFFACGRLTLFNCFSLVYYLPRFLYCGIEKIHICCYIEERLIDRR